MIAFRNAVQVTICDGCFSLISKPGEDDRTIFTRWRCKDGREGHVCSPECGDKFEANPPGQPDSAVA